MKDLWLIIVFVVIVVSVYYCQKIGEEDREYNSPSSSSYSTSSAPSQNTAGTSSAPSQTLNSKNSLELMGFTARSTKADVEQKLNAWGIEYNWDGSERSIRAEGINYENFFWPTLCFYFKEDNMLAAAFFYGLENDGDVVDVFERITKQYPLSSKTSRAVLKSGGDDNECVAMYTREILTSGMYTVDVCYIFDKKFCSNRGLLLTSLHQALGY